MSGLRQPIKPTAAVTNALLALMSALEEQDLPVENVNIVVSTRTRPPYTESIGTFFDKVSVYQEEK